MTAFLLFLVSLSAYVIVGATLRTSGVSIKDWQFSVIVFCALVLQVSSYALGVMTP